MVKGESTIRQGYAQLVDVRLHYAEVRGGEHLVLLLHGFPEFWYSWRHQLRALGNHFHVVAPDMRGYNLSDKPRSVGDYKISVLVEDILRLIEYFGAKRAAIVGHDWGGSVAWAVAQRHPDRICRLVVLQTPPRAAWRANMTFKQLCRIWYMFFFQLPRVPEWLIRRKQFRVFDRLFTRTVYRKGAFTPADIEQYKEAFRQPGALTSAINYYRANVRRIAFRPERRLSDPGVSVPTLFIYGEKDFVILPTTVRGIESYVQSDYRELRISDSGHWVQNEAPGTVNEALLEFLSIEETH